MAKLLATDETLSKVSQNLEKIAGYVGVLAVADLEDTISDPQKFHEIIQAGLAPSLLSVGDQIVIAHSDFGNIVWDIIGFDHDIDATGHKHSVTIQTHKVIGEFQFDHEENEVATEGTFSADYSYYIADSSQDSGFKYLTPNKDYYIGNTIPSGITYYHSAIEDSTGYIVKYGYNNWEHSALRQYLNSESEKGQWWKAKHLGDVAPAYATTKDGFLKGLDADFKKIIGTTKKVTALNTVTDGGSSVELIEKIFLLSRTEVSGGTENNIAEGTPYEYYSNLVGSVNSGASSGRIKYSSNGSAHWWGLRDPNTGHSYSVRHCNEDGSISYNNALNTSRGLSPACILI
jgi:hypothetical protein